MSEIISGFEFGRLVLDQLEKKGVKFPDRITRIVIDIQLDDNPKIYYSCLAEAKVADVFSQIIAGKDIKITSEQQELKIEKDNDHV